jgi:hypothetical protein
MSEEKFSQKHMSQKHGHPEEKQRNVLSKF